MICPNCKSNLEGGLIYETFLEQTGNEEEALTIAAMYGATKTEGKWGREICIYDLYEDKTTHWQCPDCGHTWPRYFKI